MPYHDDEPQPLDLKEFLSVLRRRKWSVIVPTLLVTAAALAWVYQRTALYSSTARVEVLPKTAQDSLAPGLGATFANMDTESARVTSTQIEGRAADILISGGQEASLATDADISVAVPANTTYLDITCTTDAAPTAQACAQAFADAYVADRKALVDEAAAALRKPLETKIARATAKIEELETAIAATTDPEERASLERQQTAVQQILASARLTLDGLPRAADTPAQVVTPADLPTEPSNKDYVTVGILAAILGIALGIGLAFVRQRTDSRVGEHEGLDLLLDAPVLAVVPHVNGRGRAKEPTVDALADPEGRAAEAYRSARPVLLHRAGEHDVKSILVTGPGQGEGKSTSVANLGVVLARSGYRVAMLSCDLRKPALHRLFGLPSEPGLSEVLQRKIDLRDALKRTWVPNLLLLPSGGAPANPAELLGSGAMAAVVAELRANADFVLLDTPPSLVVGDALELAPFVDAILVVVDGSTTTQADVVRLRAQLDHVGSHLIGCVLNNLDPKAVARYGSYYSSAYRYGGQRSGGRRREDRERGGWGDHGPLPRAASEVNVSLGSSPFDDLGVAPNGNGSQPPDAPVPPIPPAPGAVEEPDPEASSEASPESEPAADVELEPAADRELEGAPGPGPEPAEGDPNPGSPGDRDMWR